MPVIDRLKRFIRGEERKQPTRTVPSCVKLETDITEYWTLADVVGDGAFGNVYKAVSKADPNRIAAAKSMELDDDEGTDVMVEVEILSKCHHPNIVLLYEAYTLGNRITLLLEFCGGGAIDSIMIELSRGLTEVQIQYIMKEILKALKYLHDMNIIHRDLKAGNVLLTTNAEVKLADFGVSALCKDAKEERSTFIGTPYWMAPEVMLCETFPEKKYNSEADLWSFGITMIEMADERPPYAEMNPAKVVFKIIKADPPTLEKPNQWSENFNDAISKCLVKNPLRRLTAMELLRHPFFEKDGDIRAVQRLIYEMNAELVTTEVVEPDFDDDDDTSSSVDLRSGGDTRSELIELFGEEKGRNFAKDARGDAPNVVQNSKSESVKEERTVIKESGEVVEEKLEVDASSMNAKKPNGALQQETISTLKNSDASNAIGNLKTVDGKLLNDIPIIPVTGTPKEEIISCTDLSMVRAPKSASCSTLITVPSSSLNNVSVSGTIKMYPTCPYGHAACSDVLADLDDALDNEESSPRLELIPEEPNAVAPSSLLPLTSSASSSGSEDDDSIKGKENETRVIPTHNIRDIVGRAKYCDHSMLHNDERKLTPVVQVSRDAAFRKFAPIETVERSIPLHKAFARNDAASRQVQASFKLSDSKNMQVANNSQQTNSGKAVFSKTANNECSSCADISILKENIPLNERTKKYFTRENVSKAKSELALSSGFVNDSRKQQGLKAAFKLMPSSQVAPELVAVEVGRPASYPNATCANLQKLPLCSTCKNEASSLPPSVEMEEMVDDKNNFSILSRNTSSVSHDLTPSTSSADVQVKKPLIPNNFNYFESASTSSEAMESERNRQNLEHNKVGSYAPPPEPPVDYDDEKKGVSDQMKEGTVSKKATDHMGSRKSPHRQTVTKKTRVYMVDGVQMTSTSHQVFGVKQDFELRKQQLHDLRRMQREEARQQRELTAKAEALRNDQAKRFAAEKDSVMRNSEVELVALARNQKRQMREAEDSHNEAMKQTLKKIQSDQEKELRAFREVLKYEQKQLKLEIDALPKLQRKEMLRLRREQLEKDQAIRENDFLEQQHREQGMMIMRVQIDHKLKILQLEKTFQQQKQGVLRSREAALWDLEEKQLDERHALYKQELKDRFFLQRSQMMARHQREHEHMKKVNEMNEEEAFRSYAVYKKRLPKDFRTESKTRIAMFKESLRINCQGDDMSTISEKLRAFEEKEKIRIRKAIEDHDVKVARKLRELKEKNMQQIKELEDIHNEKRKMLWEAENSKLEKFEKEYEQVIADWKANLPLRKRELEAGFAKELDELDAFYRKENAQLQSITSKPISVTSGF